MRDGTVIAVLIILPICDRLHSLVSQVEKVIELRM